MNTLKTLKFTSPLAYFLALVLRLVKAADHAFERFEDWLLPLGRPGHKSSVADAPTPEREEPLPGQNSIEREFCSSPSACLEADVIFVGSGISLESARYLLEQAKARLGRPLRVAILEMGPFDMLTHLSNTSFPRGGIIRAGTERIGGKLVLWGVSAPRPPNLKGWPYPFDDLCRRFEAVEKTLGVPERIPASGLKLEELLLSTLQNEFPNFPTRIAPLAINGLGRRWSPVGNIPYLAREGTAIVSRFHCTDLEITDGKATAIRGQWMDGQTWTLKPRVVVLGVGVEHALPLLRQICGKSLPLETADHIRIDLHGMLPKGAYGAIAADELGVAVLLLECRSKVHGIPFHLEIKVAPVAQWRQGNLPSADNLQNVDAEDDAIWCQIQTISAMHDRFPAADLLNVRNPVPPVMSSRDASLHGEIVDLMQRVSTSLGLSAPTFAFRPLTTNHHLYGALRVGKGVTKEFRFEGVDNLFVLPPTAFVDCDDDANPTLKSLVLAQYAMDAVVKEFASPPRG